MGTTDWRIAGWRKSVRVYQLSNFEGETEEMWEIDGSGVDRCGGGGERGGGNLEGVRISGVLLQGEEVASEVLFAEGPDCVFREV